MIASMLLWPCLMTSLSAQTNQIKWYRATEGLPANHVNTIVQDSSGFIWIGTNLGVCRFDGYSFSRFESPNKKFSNSVVLSMCLDSTNRGLWIAEDEGVFQVAQDGKVTELLQLSDGKLRSLIGTSSILLVHGRGCGLEPVKDATVSIRPRATGDRTDGLYSHQCTQYVLLSNER